MKAYLLRVWAFLLFVAIAAQSQAAYTPPTAPTYTGNAFDDIQAVASDGMLFFGFIVAAAIIVTGFFLGRRWFARVG